MIGTAPLQEWEGADRAAVGVGAFFNEAKRSQRKKVFCEAKKEEFSRKVENGDGTLRTFEKYK